MGGQIITVLFTDLVGSTELLAAAGPAEGERLRREHFELLRRSIAAHGGTEVKNIGDGVMAVFPTATSALLAAEAIQQAAEERNGLDPARPMRIRVGVNTGEASAEGDDWFGMPVVVAKRLCDFAGGGQVLATRIVHHLADLPADRFADVGPLELKGVGEPTDAVELRWAPRAADVWLPATLADVEGTFVGRRDHLASLLDAWGTASAGTAQLVLLAGEPGIGKTRLAAELARRITRLGGAVLAGGSDEDSTIPYQPFAEALREWARRVEPAPAGGDDADELARLVPELGGRARAGVEADRFRLFEAFTNVLATMAAEAPTLLVLDDLHWCDKPTLLLLRHVLRSAASTPLLVVGTYRDTDLDRRHPLAEVLPELRREPAMRRLPLDGLDDREVAELLAEREGTVDERDEAFAAAVRAETEGNPFFVSEIRRSLKETGAAGRVEELGIPEGVREVIGRRLTRLGDAVGEVLAAAAVIGRDFDVAVLEQVTGAEGDSVLDALEAALRSRLVVETAAAGRYRFVHALVRQTLYEELSALRRGRVHRAVADALEARLPDAPGPELPTVARHRLAAVGVVEPAAVIASVVRAGDYAIEVLAFEEAASLYADALEVAEVTDDPSTIADLCRRLGAARFQANDIDGGRDAYRRAAEVARAAGDVAGFCRAAIGISGYDVGMAMTTLGLPDQDAYLLGAEAEAMLLAADWRGDAELIAVRARLGVARSIGDVLWGEDQIPVAEELLAAARELGEPATLRDALLRYGFRVIGVEVEEAIAALSEAAAIEGEPRVQLWVLQWLTDALLVAGDIDGLRQRLVEHRALAERRRAVHMIATSTFSDATVATVEGRYADAEVLTNGALAISERAGYVTGPQSWTVQIAAIAVERDGGVGLRDTVREMYDEYPNPEWLAALALMSANAGDHDGSLELLRRQRADDGFAVFDNARGLTIGLGLVGDAARVVADEVSADALLPRLRRYRGRNLHVSPTLASYGPADGVEARLLALLGDRAASRERFEAALASCARQGAGPRLAITEVDFAEELVDWAGAGDRALASALLDRAEPSLARFGMPWHAARAAALRTRLA